MRVLTAAAARAEIVIQIGGLPVRLRSDDPTFLQLLENRYAGFAMRGPNPYREDSGWGDARPADSSGTQNPRFVFDVDLAPPGWTSMDPEEELRVAYEGGRWTLERGDFFAEWETASGRGRIRQTANPYSIDSVLRILHTILLAGEGGFLVHAASAVRNGRAYLFAGLSGAGKTTIAQLAPDDAKLLTDEVSYVRREGDAYYAYGTPFTGELARVGKNVRAPIAAVYLLTKGGENKIEPVGLADAARRLLENILFFAQDGELVKRVFGAACDFAGHVPVERLTFVPDARVWELIR